jgi:hypothetical protein
LALEAGLVDLISGPLVPVGQQYVSAAIARDNEHFSRRHLKIISELKKNQDFPFKTTVSID